MKFLGNIPTSPMDVIPIIGKVLQRNGGDDVTADSLIDYTQPTRVEPNTLVEQALWREPYMEDILQTVLSIFSGYYMQAVSLSAEIKGIKVVRRLEPFNPKRDPMREGINELIGSFSFEADTSFGLPTLESMSLPGAPASINWAGKSKSAVTVESDSTPAEDKKGKKGGDKPSVFESSSKETLMALRENSNLAVGKIIEVTVIVDDVSVKVPVTVRLQTVPVPSKSMFLYLIAAARKISLKERWFEYKAGNLALFSDLFFVRDLLDQHRKNVIKDGSGLYLKQMEQKRKNQLAGLISRRPSVANASNIVVITEETQVAIERELNIDITTLKGRRVLENNSSIMLLVVVDRGYEQVSIYHRGIEGVTTLSVNSVKNSSKAAGPDIMKVLEAYKTMKAPSF